MNGDKNVCEQIQETKDLSLIQTFLKHNRFIRLSKQRIIQLNDYMNVLISVILKLGYSSFLIHINRPIYALRNTQLYTYISALKSLSKLSSVVNVNKTCSVKILQMQISINTILKVLRHYCQKEMCKTSYQNLHKIAFLVVQ